MTTRPLVPTRTPERLPLLLAPLAGLVGLVAAVAAARAIAAARIGATRGRARLGAAWWILDPILQIGGWLLFVAVIRGGAHDSTAAAAIAACVASWRALITVAMETGDGYITGSALTRMPALPRVALPLAAALTATFGAAFSILIVAGFLALVAPAVALAAALPLFALFAIGLVTGAGLGMCLAAVSPFSPDLRRFLRSTLRVDFFATPVLYGLDHVESPLLFTALSINPLSPLFEAIRAAVAGSLTPGGLLLPAGVALLLLAFGAGACRRLAGRIAAAV